MKQETIKVIFRKFVDSTTDQIIAIFPELAGDQDWEGTCLSYQHIGQHGAANTDLSEYTVPCREEEYEDLKKELENIGYSLKIVKQMPKWAADIRSKQVRGEKS